MPQQLVLLLLVFLGLVPIGCCKEELRDYANLRGLRLFLTEPTAGSPLLTGGSRTSAPELKIDVVPEFDHLAAAPTGALFTGAAQALTCPEPGDKGLKDQATAVSLVSTGRFNGVAAGQSLNQFVRCRGGLSRFRNLDFPLAQLADSLNAWKGGRYGELNNALELRISPKPADNAEHKFELRIRLQSGKEVVQATPTIFWD